MKNSRPRRNKGLTQRFSSEIFPTGTEHTYCDMRVALVTSP